MSESPDSVAARLAGAGPDVAGVQALAAVEPELSDDGAWDGVRALDRQIAWLQARQLALLARAADAVPRAYRDDNHDWAQEELSCALTISATAAADRLGLARMLSRRPTVAALLARGDTSLAHVRVLDDETRELDLVAAAVVDADVLDAARRQTPASFRRTVRRAVLRRVPPEFIGERYESARAQRFVAGVPAEYGMAQLRALLPAGDFATVMAAIDAVARRVEPGDTRTPDQRRADALTQICIAVLTGTPVQSLLTEHHIRPMVHVVAAESTLAGADDEPAELDGQPIPASLARALAADPSATRRRLPLAHPGRSLDRGRSTRRPPAALADFVLTRDRTCVFPGCNRSARRCDIDHRIRWRDGGATDHDNLQALCRRHHRAKDLAGWRSELLPDGSIRWTSRTGRVYLREPARYPTAGPAPPRRTGSVAGIRSERVPPPAAPRRDAR